MTIEVWYWIIMFLWLVIGLWLEYVPGQPYPLFRAGRQLLVFLLFLLLGWKVFGSPVR